MKPVISIRSIHNGFKIAFSYISHGKECPIKDIFSSESLVEKYYLYCIKDLFIRNKWDNESIFEQSFLSADEMFYIVKNWETLTEIGFEIRVPKNFNRNTKMEIRVSSTSKQPLTAKIAIDGVEMDGIYGKLTEILSNVIFFNGKWQVIDADLIHKIRNTPDLNMVNVLKLLQDKKAGILSDNITVKNIPIPCDFKGNTQHFNGQLKPYQQEAVKMLYSALKCNRNIMLADDMGLGKTITIISLLNILNNDNKAPNLIVVPKSLVGNWCKELYQFAPNIKFSVVDSQIDLKHNTYITTYGHVLCNPELYQSVHWNLITIDEAQQIKNHTTKQSKLVCSLKGNHKIAMTGTPIENSLMDLWSIFQFLEPGLLGEEKEFKSLEQNEETFRWLQGLLMPYFIRRVKTDKTLDLNLPDKNEHTLYCEMTSEQISLYNAIIDHFKADLKHGKSKAGIFKYINLLKLACSDPGAILTSWQGKDIPCKLKAVQDLLERKGKQKVIVFTQYRNTAQILDRFLTRIYGESGLVIDGKLSAKKRTQIAYQFQSGLFPYIILTLKAGNSGLTLTQAHTVIHFDRWWNPSVENQATDRSHRIGQTKDVDVYKLVCKGTLEERINAILEEKQSLFDKVINPMAMSVGELLDLVSYKGGAT